MFAKRCRGIGEIEDNAAVFVAAAFQKLLTDVAGEFFHLQFGCAGFRKFLLEEFFAVFVAKLGVPFIDKPVDIAGEGELHLHAFGINRGRQVMAEFHADHLGTGIEGNGITLAGGGADIVADRVHGAVAAGGHDHRFGLDDVELTAAVVKAPGTGNPLTVLEQSADDGVAQRLDAHLLALSSESFHDVFARRPVVMDHPGIGVPFPRALIVFVVVADQVHAPAAQFLGKATDRIDPGLHHDLVGQPDPVADHVAEMNIGIIPFVGMAKSGGISRQGLGGIAGGVRTLGDNQHVGAGHLSLDRRHGTRRA